MDTQTVTPESAGPGWRELVESLHEQLEAARDRETRLLQLLQMDREALVHLSRTGRPRQDAARPPGEPSLLHAQIFAVLQQHPEGYTRIQIETALGTYQPLEGVLHGLFKRGRLRRLAKGLYALPTVSGKAEPTP